MCTGQREVWGFQSAGQGPWPLGQFGGSSDPLAVPWVQGWFGKSCAWCAAARERAGAQRAPREGGAFVSARTLPGAICGTRAQAATPALMQSGGRWQRARGGPEPCGARGRGGAQGRAETPRGSPPRRGELFPTPRGGLRQGQGGVFLGSPFRGSLLSLSVCSFPRHPSCTPPAPGPPPAGLGSAPRTAPGGSSPAAPGPRTRTQVPQSRRPPHTHTHTQESAAANVPSAH